MRKNSFRKAIRVLRIYGLMLKQGLVRSRAMPPIFLFLAPLQCIRTVFWPPTLWYKNLLKNTQSVFRQIKNRSKSRLNQRRDQLIQQAAHTHQVLSSSCPDHAGLKPTANQPTNSDNTEQLASLDFETSKTPFTKIVEPLDINQNPLENWSQTVDSWIEQGQYFANKWLQIIQTVIEDSVNQHLVSRNAFDEFKQDLQMISERTDRLLTLITTLEKSYEVA